MTIAIIFVFAALAALTPTMIHAIKQSVATTMGTATAGQLHQVQTAAKGYISDYATSLEAVATPTSPAQVTVPMLVSTGFLPNGFQATDPYGQTYEVEVLQPAPGNLQALVLTTGGQAINPADAGRIATESGHDGGVVKSDGYAHGAYGGWRVSMSGYPDPGTGHLAALIDYNQGTMQSDYLYRTAVSGQPQLNQMQTNLGMGNNDINNAKDVTVNSKAQVGTPYNTTGGTTGSLPGQLGVDEPAGNGFPSGWGGGIRTYDLFANGTIGAGTGGVTQAFINSTGTVHAGYYLQLGSAGGTNTVGHSCWPDGSISASTSAALGVGTLMVCVNGAWIADQPNNEYVHNGGSWHNYSWNGSTGSHYVGWWRLCTLSNNWVGGGGGGGGVRIVGGPNANGQYQWDLDTETDTSDSFKCWN